MQIIEVTQGSPEWLAHRAKCWNASEAPAMMGASKYTTRADLLREKATGIAPEVNAATQRLFDAGHAAEAGVRPLIENLIGEDLYPVTASLTVDGMPLSASYDGLTMDDCTVLEVKLWNESLAERVRAGDLEPHYYWQLEQQLMIVGAEKAIFATGDGTAERLATMEYRAVPGRREQLIAGWKQFAADLAVWKPEDAPKEMPQPEVTVALPALFIRAKGEITTSNMKEYGEALTARLAQIRAITLVTDQDFSNAKESAKMLRESIDAAKQAKAAMLAETVSVGEAARMIDAWCEDMRLTALQLEKDVEREDRNKKTAMVMATTEKFVEHVEALRKRIAPVTVLWPAPVFADALKGKRNFASMQDALDTMLANAKLEANAKADLIDRNLRYLREHASEFKGLFADTNAIVLKQPDDLQALVTARISEHRAEIQRQAEAAAERERDRIRREEQAAAESRAREEAAARERQEREARDALERQQREAAQAAAAPAPIQTPAAAPIAAPAPAPTHMAPPASVTGPVIAAPAANVVQMVRSPEPDEAPEWNPPETLPQAPTEWIQVQEIALYRFLPYKPNSTEFKRGKKGRWQRHNGYGFDNAEPPTGPWRIGEETASDQSEDSAARDQAPMAA